MICQKDHFLNEEEVNSLLEYFHKDPVDLNDDSKMFAPKHLREKHPVITRLLKKVRECHKNIKLIRGYFFCMKFPLKIHVDNSDFKKGYDPVSFLIPLQIKPNNKKEASCFFTIFNQTYDLGSQYFYLGDDVKPTPDYSGYPIKNDYSDISNLDFSNNDILSDPHLSHLNPKWLRGLSVYKHIPWKIGSLILFPSNHLHCSSNFEKVGINFKLFISLFGVKR